MLNEIAEHVRLEKIFAFETTLSGRSYLSKIREWRKQQYQVKLFFLSLTDSAEAIARVRTRVLLGGHNIPEEVIKRRFISGFNNFKNIYRHEVNFWRFV